MLGRCRTHEYCEYKGVYLDVLEGKLGINVWSSQADHRDGRKKITRHGFPYKLIVGFSVDLYRDFSTSKVILESLKATGTESGKVLTFPKKVDEFTRVRSPDKEEKDQPGYSRFQFIITEDMGVTYEPFDIEADIKIIYADGTEKSEHIKVRLEKDYKKKRQSDTWDYLRSM